MKEPKTRNSDKKKKAFFLISKIDSGEASLFENYNTAPDNYILYRFFNYKSNNGIFFSFVYNNKLRIHISFESDTDEFNEEVYELIIRSVELSKIKSGVVWLRNDNKKIIKNLQEKSLFHSKGIKNSHYSSVEYVMKRDNFIYKSNDTLDIRSYEDNHIDRYLALLDESMDFCIPPAKYLKNKITYQEKFLKLRKANSFEAFWMEEELVGLYWRSGAEIEIMAVSAKNQRKGYGSIILTRAIECVFNYVECEDAYLYCVDWNEKGKMFYNKYGMELCGHSFMLSFC